MNTDAQFASQFSSIQLQKSQTSTSEAKETIKDRESAFVQATCASSTPNPLQSDKLNETPILANENADRLRTPHMGQSTFDLEQRGVQDDTSLRERKISILNVRNSLQRLVL